MVLAVESMECRRRYNMAEQSLKSLNHSNKELIWAQRISECRNSGMRVQDWCRENGLSYHTYYKWQQRLFHKCIKTNAQFYEIDGAYQELPLSQPAVVIHAGMYSVDVNSGADAHTIRNVIEALKC